MSKKSGRAGRGFERPILAEIVRRLRERRRFIQVLAGPRQTGKTTLAQQAIARLGLPTHYASADAPAVPPGLWIQEQWERARRKIGEARRRKAGLLVLDEVHKVPGWSDQVKRQWDADTRSRTSLRVLLLGSSPLLMQRGLGESLAGRFEVLPVTHWSFREMRDAFGWDLDRFVYYGGYPGAAPLATEPARWGRYITDSLVETTLSRDILLLTRVDKPALLRQLLMLACEYSGQVLSYNKMLGRLHDAGNTTTLAHYLDLLRAAGFVAGLPKYSARRLQVRSSSPKLIVQNTALLSATRGESFEEARADGEVWGRLVESAVGAHLLAEARPHSAEVLYWQDRNREVDFVVRAGRRILAVEVKSGRRKGTLPGAEAFLNAHRGARFLLVGADGVPLDEFLAAPLAKWL